MNAEPYQVMPPLAAGEYEALKASIAAGYDTARPVVVDEAGNVLDGHHRLRVCTELGITAPTIVLPGLTEDAKRDYALRVNLACRHLTQTQKRDLIRSELDRNPERSDRQIGKLCGVDHKTVGAVRRGEIPHGDQAAAYEQIRRGVTDFIAKFGFASGDEVTVTLTEHLLVQEAARGLVRYGIEDLPPVGWKAIDEGASIGGRKRALSRERNRLAEWQLRVQYEAGTFLNWCEEAGITFRKGHLQLAEQLRYPMPAEARPADWTAEDEHLAAIGHFYSWWCTRDELHDMSEAS